MGRRTPVVVREAGGERLGLLVPSRGGGVQYIQGEGWRWVDYVVHWTGGDMEPVLTSCGWLLAYPSLRTLVPLRGRDARRFAAEHGMAWPSGGVR